jgi:hypothetical protein
VRRIAPVAPSIRSRCRFDVPLTHTFPSRSTETWRTPREVTRTYCSTHSSSAVATPPIRSTSPALLQASDVAEPGGRVDDPVAVPVLALAVLEQADLDHRPPTLDVVVAVADPDVPVPVHDGSGRILRRAFGVVDRRRPVLTDDVAGVRVDLDDGAADGSRPPR